MRGPDSPWSPCGAGLQLGTALPADAWVPRGSPGCARVRHPLHRGVLLVQGARLFQGLWRAAGLCPSSCVSALTV